MVHVLEYIDDNAAPVLLGIFSNHALADDAREEYVFKKGEVHYFNLRITKQELNKFEF